MAVNLSRFFAEADNVYRAYTTVEYGCSKTLVVADEGGFAVDRNLGKCVLGDTALQTVLMEIFEVDEYVPFTEVPLDPGKGEVMYEDGATVEYSTVVAMKDGYEWEVTKDASGRLMYKHIPGYDPLATYLLHHGEIP
jgi:hypothetical protein